MRPDFVVGQLEELGAVARLCAEELAPSIGALAETVRDVLAADGKIMFCGNGGSAADAQHLAAEYVVRFDDDRAPLSAIALTADSSVITAGGNDLGFVEIFARQVAALGIAGDLLIIHSTSGESENLLRAAEVARTHDVRTAALIARGGGRLAALVDMALIVPTDVTARAQEMHLAIGHIVCALVERGLVEDSG